MVLCCYALLNERSGICVHRNLAWISHWAGLWGNYWNTTHETDVMIITSSDISCDIVVTCQKVSYTNLVYMMYLQLSFIMAVFSRFVLLEIPYNPWNIRRYLCNAHCLSIITQLTYTVQLWVYLGYSISQEICTRFLLCYVLLWLYPDWFIHIHQHQAYFTGTVAI